MRNKKAATQTAVNLRSTPQTTNIQPPNDSTSICDQCAYDGSALPSPRDLFVAYPNRELQRLILAEIIIFAFSALLWLLSQDNFVSMTTLVIRGLAIAVLTAGVAWTLQHLRTLPIQEPASTQTNDSDIQQMLASIPENERDSSVQQHKSRQDRLRELRPATVQFLCFLVAALILWILSTASYIDALLAFLAQVVPFFFAIPFFFPVWPVVVHDGEYWMMFSWKLNRCLKVVRGGLHFIYTRQNLCYFRNNKPVDFVFYDQKLYDRRKGNLWIEALSQDGLVVRVFGDAEFTFNPQVAQHTMRSVTDLIRITDQELVDQQRRNLTDLIQREFKQINVRGGAWSGGAFTLHDRIAEYFQSQIQYGYENIAFSVGVRVPEKVTEANAKEAAAEADARAKHTDFRVFCQVVGAVPTLGSAALYLLMTRGTRFRVQGDLTRVIQQAEQLPSGAKQMVDLLQPQAPNHLLAAWHRVQGDVIEGEFIENRDGDNTYDNTGSLQRPSQSPAPHDSSTPPDNHPTGGETTLYDLYKGRK